MKQTLDLNKMGLVPMNAIEMQEIDGGDIDGLMHGSNSGDGFVLIYKAAQKTAHFFEGLWDSLSK